MFFSNFSNVTTLVNKKQELMSDKLNHLTQIIGKYKINCYDKIMP